MFLVVSALGILVLSPLAYELWKKRFGNSLGTGEDLSEEFDPFANSVTNFMPFGELLVKLEELFDKLFPGQSTPQLQPAFAGEGPVVVEPDEAARAEVFLEFTKGNSLDTLEEEPPLISRPIANIEAVPMEAPIKPKPKPRGSRKNNKPPKWVSRAWAGLTGVIVTGLLALAFLLPSSSGPHTKPIGEVRLGERSNAHHPKGDFDDKFGVDVDPATWRQIILRAEKEGGGNCWIELLRPTWWLDLNQAKVGGRVHISIPECGVNDEALVLSIGPCPPIAPGDGPIITGKFIHDAARVIDVYIEGQAKPIGSTPNHRFWSVDRQEFVRADELKPGETLQAAGDTIKFLKAVPRENPERVYNLEIQGEHVYRVSPLGVLVHNTTGELPMIWIDENVFYMVDDLTNAGYNVQKVTSGMTDDAIREMVEKEGGILITENFKHFKG